MVIEVVRYLVPPGQESGFEKAYDQASKALARSSHCLGYSLIRAANERNRYILMIYWDTPDGDMIAFRQSSDFKVFSICVEPYGAMIEEDQHYRKTGIDLVKHQLVRISGPPRQ